MFSYYTSRSELVTIISESNSYQYVQGNVRAFSYPAGEEPASNAFITWSFPTGTYEHTSDAPPITITTFDDYYETTTETTIPYSSTIPASGSGEYTYTITNTTSESYFKTYTATNQYEDPSTIEFSSSTSSVDYDTSATEIGSVIIPKYTFISATPSPLDVVWAKAKAPPPPLRDCGSIMLALDYSAKSQLSGLVSYKTITLDEIDTYKNLITYTYSTYTEGQTDNPDTNSRGVISYYDLSWDNKDAELSVSQIDFLENAYFLNSSFASFGNSFSFSPTITSNTFDLFVPVGQSAYLPNIFTNNKECEINGSSASMAWKISGSTYYPVATLKNSSTETTISLSFGISGSSTFDTKTQTFGQNISSYFLPPYFKYKSEFCNITTSISFCYIKKEAGVLSKSSFSGTTYSNTSGESGVVSLNSSDSASFSKYSYFMRIPAISISQTITSQNIGIGGGFATFNYPPCLEASKWNEAGQADPVSVQYLE